MKVQKYYTLNELVIARQILADNSSFYDGHIKVAVEDGQIIYGDAYYPEEWITWAYRVVKWWRMAWKIARLYYRHWVKGWGYWSDAISFLWQALRGLSKASAIRLLLVKTRKDSQRQKIREAIAERERLEHDTYTTPVRAKHKQSTRAPKWRLRARAQQITDTIQSTAVRFGVKTIS